MAVNISYQKARFHRRCFACLLDFLIFAILFGLSFLACRSIVTVTPGFQQAEATILRIREESGLAMSSRNTLLTPEERVLAANIYRILHESTMLHQSVGATHDYVVQAIDAIDGLQVQYYNIVDGKTLADVSSWDEADDIVGCITVFCGHTPIRLIDHIRYK